jgi:tRNA-dihydrouridine synthase
MIESTGVSAIGVHGRTKEERPAHPNNDEVIATVVKVIASAASSGKTTLLTIMDKIQTI